MAERREDFAHLMFRVYGTMHGSLFRATTPTEGLGRPELGLLGFLHSTGGSSQGEAAEKCHMAKSQLSLIVERLVEKGLVERIKDTDDRRMAHIKATVAGEAALGAAFEGVRQRIAEFLAPLSKEDMKTLRRAFELMAGLIEKENSGKP